MRDRILFILFSTLLALACVLLSEWMVDIETRTHTDAGLLPVGEIAEDEDGVGHRSMSPRMK